MKLIAAVVLALVAVYVTAEEPLKIIRSNFQSEPDSGYNFGFETENGIAREETGEIREAKDDDNQPHKVVVVRGTYTYTDPDGKPETISYFADETGYHAEGESIPKVPVV